MRTDSGHILFITQWHLDDALIQTYTLPYIRIIQRLKRFRQHTLVVFSEKTKLAVTEQEGIRIIELPYKNIQLSNSFKIFRLLNKLIRAESVSHLHAWCTPAGAIAYILKKRNAPLSLVIDSFEPHAEAMVENGEWKSYSPKFLILRELEKQQALAADFLIFAAEGMQDYIRRFYGVTVANYAVKPACVNLDMFHHEKKDQELVKLLELQDKIVCTYAGKFGGIYLDREVFQLISIAQEKWKNRFRFLLLSNISDQLLAERLKEFNIPANTVIRKFVPHKEVPRYLSVADFALSPVKPVPSKRYCSPIKNGEYWASGLPVIITQNISTDSDLIARTNSGCVIEDLSDESLRKALNAIETILAEPGSRQRIRTLAESHRNFAIAEKVYSRIYDGNMAV